MKQVFWRLFILLILAGLSLYQGGITDNPLSAKAKIRTANLEK